MKEATGIMTNSWCIVDELEVKCSGGHDHVWLRDGKAKGAERYPEKLCEAICRGLQIQR